MPGSRSPDKSTAMTLRNAVPDGSVSPSRHLQCPLLLPGHDWAECAESSEEPGLLVNASTAREDAG